MKDPQFGPWQQSMTGVRFDCGAEANEFLGAHNPATPYWHPCDCSPKHSSLPTCHRCSCESCAAEISAWRVRIAASRAAGVERNLMKQLELFA
jgi:hypothetical protein